MKHNKFMVSLEHHHIWILSCQQQQLLKMFMLLMTVRFKLIYQVGMIDLKLMTLDLQLFWLIGEEGESNIDCIDEHATVPHSWWLVEWRMSAPCSSHIEDCFVIISQKIKDETRDGLIYAPNTGISRYLLCWLLSYYRQVRSHSMVAVVDVFPLCHVSVEQAKTHGSTPIAPCHSGDNRNRAWDKQKSSPGCLQD